MTRTGIPSLTSARALTVYERLGDWIDDHLDESIAFLREMLRVPTDTPPGNNAPHAVRAAALFEQMGFAVERHPVPEDVCLAHGLASVTNLVVRKRFGDGPVIALNVHGDVVPPGSGWTHAPYGGEIADGRIYGRGAAVSKSDFATYVYALRALAAVAAPQRGTIELHITYDEELGGACGPERLLAEGIVDPDYAICPGFGYALGVAHNGCIQLEATVQGVAAHAAMPETGVDALQAAIVLIEALYAHRAALAHRHSKVPGIDSPTVVVGTIEGGINTNVVPDRVKFRLDGRVIPEESTADVESELRAVLEHAALPMRGVKLMITRLLRAEPLAPLPGHEVLAAMLCEHATREFAEPVHTIATPLYTDARHYGARGVPTVLYGAGPRTLLESNAKRADENLVIEDLRKATKTVACALVDACASLPLRERTPHPRAAAPAVGRGPREQAR